MMMVVGYAEPALLSHSLFDDGPRPSPMLMLMLMLDGLYTRCDFIV